jgi:hypothetical protein
MPYVTMHCLSHLMVIVTVIIVNIHFTGHFVKEAFKKLAAFYLSRLGSTDFPFAPLTRRGEMVVDIPTISMFSSRPRGLRMARLK